MQKLLILLLWVTIGTAQETSKLELTPQGFPTQEMTTPNKLLEKLIASSKSWAYYYNKNGNDILNVTENSLTIEAKIENAFYSYNVGVRYNHDIVYSLKIVFKENKKYTLNLTIKEIYNEKVLMKITPADFFTSDGKLKDDFKDSKSSLEGTANNIIQSYSKYIAQE